ncbi:hypothetical protein [Steroidobacter sp.]|uniref:hypothetical protein n=1 Tax=Steroidobacter sp. TaxID=1978227 RepID=UPI001A5288E5|nr:hypothetical protein [Steroidobacter sp.]MBL8268588.1 hypothetical protein [Steroidobacter sp.]
MQSTDITTLPGKSSCLFVPGGAIANTNANDLRVFDLQLITAGMGLHSTRKAVPL